MKKEISNKTNRADRMPAKSRSSFFTPWFDDFFEPKKTRWWNDVYESHRFMTPAMDIDETSDSYIVNADLPGIKKENISIECSGHQLCVSAERKSETIDGRKNDRRERYYGMYQRSFRLPSDADMDKIEASYEGGVLTVQVPKGEQSRSRRIEIGQVNEGYMKSLAEEIQRKSEEDKAD